MIEFGTDGYRAIIAEDFTFSNVEAVAKAVYLYVKQTYGMDKPVIIGYDTRFLADKFAKRAADVLNELGLNVKLADRDAPTPAIAFCASEYKTAGAMMFTASHNPPEYCGIKYIPDYAGPADKEITDLIEEWSNSIASGIISVEAPINKGVTEMFSPKEVYFEQLKSLIDFEKIKTLDKNIIFDALYGTARGYFDEILAEFGIETHKIHDYRDVFFGGGMPEPKEKYLKELKELVVNTPNSIGFSNDGDADRFAVVDENGNFISPNYVIPLLFKHLKINKGMTGALVKTVGGSLLLEKAGQKFGATEVIETAVGFKWVGKAMRENQVIIGGEESGGLSIGTHIPEKDGILANLLILEMLAYENKSLSSLVENLIEEIGIRYINHRIDLKLTNEQKHQVMTTFNENPPAELGGMKIVKTLKLDGIKFYFEDNNSSILIRPSGTEPLLRVYFETDNDKKLENLIFDVEKFVKS